MKDLDNVKMVKPQAKRVDSGLKAKIMARILRDDSITHLAKEYDLSSTTLYGWRMDYFRKLHQGLNRQQNGNFTAAVGDGDVGDGTNSANVDDVSNVGDVSNVDDVSNVGDVSGVSDVSGNFVQLVSSSNNPSNNSPNNSHNSQAFNDGSKLRFSLPKVSVVINGADISWSFNGSIKISGLVEMLNLLDGSAPREGLC